MQKKYNFLLTKTLYKFGFNDFKFLFPKFLIDLITCSNYTFNQVKLSRGLCRWFNYLKPRIMPSLFKEIVKLNNFKLQSKKKINNKFI